MSIGIERYRVDVDGGSAHQQDGCPAGRVAAIAPAAVGRSEIAIASSATPSARIGDDRSVITDTIIDRGGLSVAADGADVDRSPGAVAAIAAASAGAAASVAAI